MSEKYKVIDSTVPTFITITVVDWVDLFIRSVYCDILDESLNYCIKEKGLSVHAYVYMSSHIHLIVTAPDGELQNIVRDFKKFTSKKIIEAIKEHPESRGEWLLRKFSFEAVTTGRAKNYKLWQDGFHPVILDTLEKIEQRIKYIHYNPVEAQIVFHERDYINSSYRNYEEDNAVFCNVAIEPLW
ncbi:REP-associated tyrosine transposase [Flavobacterium salmonis]|uniref:Transposase n=1 Tax=Flavobacterium salmonis TaxID=2654844 RepID=A0A6V6Z0M0_9FLAO|nr:transposase [Flavobacterium salmonis]CAD0005215.1 transposase [Flavobacterium salmonis]